MSMEEILPEQHERGVRRAMSVSFLRKVKRTLGRRYLSLRHGINRNKEYSTSLPDGFGHRRALVRISVPNMPDPPHFGFSEHVMTSDGHPTEIVIATNVGGFAISRDLGKHWDLMPVRGYEDYDFIHVHSLGDGEY